MALLTVENLSFIYPLGNARTLDGIRFELERGDFLCVLGETGSGKSTLLKMLKRELTPLGEKSGEIRYRGCALEKLSEREAASRIGFVMQRPEQQIVTDKVWHELAFGLENLGLEQSIIRSRVSEMAGYFGMESWFEQDTAELSGGQKQLLNLASVMVMQPDILILDEPTAQLDPLAATEFLMTLTRLNRELSLTIIIVEHRLEEVIPVSNRLLVLRNGRTFAFGETRRTVGELCKDRKLLVGLPAAVRLYSGLQETGSCTLQESKDECPLDVREGRCFLESRFDHEVYMVKEPVSTRSMSPALEFSEVYFRYIKELPDVLCGLSATVYTGEIFFILGGNGSGKSTALCTAAGLLRPYSGTIRVFGKKLKEYKNQSLYRECLAMLPQDVQTVFLKKTVREELEETAGTKCQDKNRYTCENAETNTGNGKACEQNNISLPYDLTELYDRHPYDLSGGEQQLVALAKVLMTRPKLLLLDEPTKGLDAAAKQQITEILKSLRDSGMTIVVVSHDVEFAADCADRCAMFFRGEIVSYDTPHRFFAGNSFYTTAVSRMTRGLYENAVTVEDAVTLCRSNGLREAAKEKQNQVLRQRKVLI